MLSPDHPNLLQIDAFADAPFTGNPACVVIDKTDVDDKWMQSFANEMNLSETAFVNETEDGWNIRWFTPTTEVDLCGHATLAAAHALWESNRMPATSSIRFNSRSGPLHASREADKIWLDFPATLLEEVPDPSQRQALRSALNLSPADLLHLAQSRFDAFVHIDDPVLLRELDPDFTAIAELPFRGVIVTSRPAENDHPDFISRFFAPAAGVDEDPVTGSAHCALAPYWSRIINRDSLLGYQASPRGGYVDTRVRGDRVDLGGHAITIFRATID